MSAADAVMPISVVLERRSAKSAWLDSIWRPIGVLPAAGSVRRGQILAEGDGWTQFYGGTLDLELFRGETEGYLTNLSQDPPVIYVVLRRTEENVGLEFAPFLVTACPYESMGYSEGSDSIVEAVPMPPDVTVWVQAFVKLHHVDVPFQKRKNRRHVDRQPGGGSDWNIT